MDFLKNRIGRRTVWKSFCKKQSLSKTHMPILSVTAIAKKQINANDNLDGYNKSNKII
jgi:hypothetical protein